MYFVSLVVFNLDLLFSSVTLSASALIGATKAAGF